MISRRRALHGLALAPALLAFRARAASWASPKLADHPLVGTIWDARAGRVVTRAALEAACAQSDLVLIGETHDNPDHHRLQLELIEAIVRAGRRPAVAMEQFDREHQAALDRARAERPGDAGYVADAGQFDRRGWEWPFYEPIVAAALRHDLPLVAANLSRRDAFAVIERGYDGLGEGVPARLGLAQPFGTAEAAAIETAVREGHCGKLPESVVPRMAAAQRARDAVMADALLARASAGAVLIAGNGHVRRPGRAAASGDARAAARGARGRHRRSRRGGRSRRGLRRARGRRHPAVRRRGLHPAYRPARPLCRVRAPQWCGSTAVPAVRPRV